MFAPAITAPDWSEMMPVIFEFACANNCVHANANINGRSRNVQFLRLVFLSCMWHSFSEVILPLWKPGNVRSCYPLSELRRFRRILLRIALSFKPRPGFNLASAFNAKLLPISADCNKKQVDTAPLQRRLPLL